MWCVWLDLKWVKDSQDIVFHCAEGKFCKTQVNLNFSEKW